MLENFLKKTTFSIATSSLIFSSFLGSVIPNIALAQNVVPSGHCSFTVASRSSLSEVRSYIENRLHGSHRPHLRVVRSDNGWFAITVGDVPRNEFSSIKNRLVSRGEVPSDSFCMNGDSYARVVSASEYSRSSSPPRSSDPDGDMAAAAIVTGAALGVGLIACSLGGIIGADCFGGGEAGPSKITFRNSCVRDDVRIYVKYLTTDDRWRTRGPWVFEYGERANLVSNGDTLWTNNSIVYYYAETLDGDVSWEGNQRVEYGDDDLNMREYRTSSDSISINLTCDN